MAEIIDAHHHLWHYTRKEYDWITPEMSVLRRDFLPEDLALAMHTAGIDGAVAVQARQTLAETDWLLALAAEFPAIRGVVGWLPIAGPEFPALLARYAANPWLKGLRHVVQAEPDDFLLRPAFNAGIAALAGTGLVYDILILDHQLPQATAFAARHPAQTFVLDHCAKPRIRDLAMQPWLDDLRRLAANPNVFCKLSGVVTEATAAQTHPNDFHPYLDAALEAFGPRRLIAGSDWPVCLVASTYANWWTILRHWASALPTADREAILGQTAVQIYRL